MNVATNTKSGKVGKGESEQRRKHDFYETPPWQTRALMRRVKIEGSILECCSGDGSLVNELLHGSWISPLTGHKIVGNIFTNDIDPERSADFHLDAALAESWSSFPTVDWVITNPPFNQAYEILCQAHEHARCGVVLLLRLSFLEPTRERSAWLAATPPGRQIILPRWSYKQNGSSDSVTTAWMVWGKGQAGCTVPLPIEIVPWEEKLLQNSASGTVLPACQLSTL